MITGTPDEKHLLNLPRILLYLKADKCQKSFSSEAKIKWEKNGNNGISQTSYDAEYTGNKQRSNRLASSAINKSRDWRVQEPCRVTRMRKITFSKKKRESGTRQKMQPLAKHTAAQQVFPAIVIYI